MADDTVKAHQDFVLVDEEMVAVVERPPLELRDHRLRRPDRDAVLAGALDVVSAADPADGRMVPGDVRIREHPVAVRRAPDAPALGTEDLAARGAERLAVGAHDFEREIHHLRPEPVSSAPRTRHRRTLSP